MNAKELRDRLTSVISSFSEIENINADCVVLIVANQQQVAVAASGLRPELSPILCTAAAHELRAEGKIIGVDWVTTSGARILDIKPERN